MPIGRQVAYAAGAGMIAYGAVVVFVPEALPMYMDDDSHMEMEMGDMPAGEMGGEGTMPEGMGDDAMPGRMDEDAMPGEMSDMQMGEPGMPEMMGE